MAGKNTALGGLHESNIGRLIEPYTLAPATKASLEGAIGRKLSPDEILHIEDLVASYRSMRMDLSEAPCSGLIKKDTPIGYYHLERTHNEQSTQAIRSRI